MKMPTECKEISKREQNEENWKNKNDKNERKIDILYK